jgi:hypothetical protein
MLEAAPLAADATHTNGTHLYSPWFKLRYGREGSGLHLSVASLRDLPYYWRRRSSLRLQQSYNNRGARKSLAHRF